MIFPESTTGTTQSEAIQLPSPILDGSCTIEKTLAGRRSVRDFRNDPISIETLSQLAWAAQGVTRIEDAPSGWTWGQWAGGKRTAPSAGAMYPLELYVVVGNVDGIQPGIYKYKPRSHALTPVCRGDKRTHMSTRGPGQKWLEGAPCLFVIAGIYARLEPRFGDRSAKYLHFEVGHVVENICLQAVALGLGSTVVGSFKDDLLKEAVGMPGEETPFAIVPVGKPKS